jgi:hypothetical protein
VNDGEARYNHRDRRAGSTSRLRAYPIRKVTDEGETMPGRGVDWKRLNGRVFHTTTGARFSVVHVTAKNLLVRPEGGRRNYDLSIHNELERGIEAYSAGRFFPSPTQLLEIGVRSVRTSYVWGVLHQLLIQDQSTTRVEAARTKDFVGYWQVTELSELDQDYFDESDELPFVSIRVFANERVYGDYHFGLSNGQLDGQLREFGGEAVLLFGYEGSDEMDPANGAGWAQLESRDRLVGEFIEYGRFTAVRKHFAGHRLESHSTKTR